MIPQMKIILQGLIIREMMDLKIIQTIQMIQNLKILMMEIKIQPIRLIPIQEKEKIQIQTRMKKVKILLILMKEKVERMENLKILKIRLRKI